MNFSSLSFTGELASNASNISERFHNDLAAVVRLFKFSQSIEAEDYESFGADLSQQSQAVPLPTIIIIVLGVYLLLLFIIVAGKRGRIKSCVATLWCLHCSVVQSKSVEASLAVLYAGCGELCVTCSHCCLLDCSSDCQGVTRPLSLACSDLGYLCCGANPAQPGCDCGQLCPSAGPWGCSDCGASCKVRREGPDFKGVTFGAFFVLLLGLCRTFAEVTKLSHAYTRSTSVTAGPTFSPATAGPETLAVAQSPAAVS